MVKYNSKDKTNESVLNATFSALADPTRRKILMHLVSGEATVLELAEPFEMSIPGISKHLKVLEKAGLIERGRSAQYRPCKLRLEPLQKADNWMDQYRNMWEDRLDQLDDYLQKLQKEQITKNKLSKGNKI
ncbi:ArsR/SmtB family transcription factor [Leptospira sp. GIMC2001]|uniref:ArsR/SmtB family transcription factor n=1 Tax=Leptospira sp. GIMC2001 TaxID=1513297 RepID=UPI00234A438F|nr:metalloregulator ArsR/SmtB family transcription factor [Leptospira sp. GIMC2001]WCL49122.1 metalloregulator ArsR/SmtB family transcription factor [Leptospira sp. GIMC2001]